MLIRIVFAVGFLLSSSFYSALADEAPAIELGDEYSDYSKSNSSGGSVATGSERSLFVATLLYLPNRLLDFLDIFRVDVGVGPSFGAVARVTKWGQVGYRDMEPLSIRVGLRGRRLPIFVERSAEFGIGPTFLTSPERSVRPLEFGAGADLILAGAYFGLSIDELADFCAGILGFDPGDDDI